MGEELQNANCKLQIANWEMETARLGEPGQRAVLQFAICNWQLAIGNLK
jgi:hypothetical protein